MDDVAAWLAGVTLTSLVIGAILHLSTPEALPSKIRQVTHRGLRAFRR